MLGSKKGDRITYITQVCGDHNQVIIEDLYRKTHADMQPSVFNGISKVVVGISKRARISEFTRDHFWDPVSASLIYVPSTRISDVEKTTAFL